MTDYGSCWSCVTDLTIPSTIASGKRVVAEAVCRRWQTPRGTLVDDPNYGLALVDYINDDLSPTDLAQLQHDAASEAEKDERVLSCDVSIVLTKAGVLIIDGTINTAEGPFQLVVSISNLTVTLLQVA